MNNIPRSPARVVPAVCLLLLVIAISGCRQKNTEKSEATEAAPRLSSYDDRVRPLLAQMTLDEKIGQMTQADNEYIKDPADVTKYFLGSVLSGGNSDPKEGNSLQAWTEMYDRYQNEALKTRLKIPILYGVDAVHGHNNVLGAVVFPHNIGLGASNDAELVERVSRATAEEVRATGIQWAFAPCVAAPQDERWGRTYEGFSEDPAISGRLGAAAVRGLQGTDLGNPLSVLACSKHFAGDGGTKMGTGTTGEKGLDQGDVQSDTATFRRLHVSQYEPSIAAGVATIMPSYNSFNGKKVSGERWLLTDVLKQEMGFEGFLISDYRAVDQVDKDYKTAIEKSINAGMDMVMVPDRYPEFIKLLKELVQENRVPMARIDDAVTRILRVKFAMGLMDTTRSHLADRKLHQTSFGSAEHRALAREAVRKSLVLLKNDNKALPLSKTAARIHVAGKNADDIGNQCGGWTIMWQGQSGKDVMPGGTTILAAMQKAVGNTEKVTFSADGTGAEGATVGVVVIGETPYAEMMGDRTDLALAPEDVQAVANMKKAGIPVVVVVVSGRPLILGDVLNQADAVVAAWLPGTEGDGVADVLFGDHKPTAKLSFSWPRSMAQIPINQGDASYDPLFKLGHGLTY